MPLVLCVTSGFRQPEELCRSLPSRGGLRISLLQIALSASKNKRHGPNHRCSLDHPSRGVRRELACRIGDLREVVEHTSTDQGPCEEGQTHEGCIDRDECLSSS